MTGPTPTVTQRAVKVMAQDVVPSSADHWARLVVCGVLVALGCFVIVRHPAGVPWERPDLIIALGPIAGGLAIAFTGSILSILRVGAGWLPWKKNGNGDPPSPDVAP